MPIQLGGEDRGLEIKRRSSPFAAVATLDSSALALAVIRPAISTATTIRLDSAIVTAAPFRDVSRIGEPSSIYARSSAPAIAL